MTLAQRRRVGLGAILAGITASALMQTMLSTAMPRVASDLDAAGVYGWVFAAYLLASTLPLPLFSHLADHRGRRTFFLVGIGVYLIGTLATALAPSAAVLVLARVIQGVGAASLVPSALGAIADLTGSGRGRFFGAVGAVQVIANVLGPILGGWFTDGPGWRYGLLAVVPVCALSAIAAGVGLPHTVRASWANTWRAFDAAEPVRTIARDPRMRRVAGATLVIGAVLMTTTAYLPLLVQAQLGGSAGRSSIALVPLMVGAGLGSILGGMAAERASMIASRAAWTLVALGLVGLAVVSLQHGSLGWLVTVAGLTGVGVGTLMPIQLVQAQAIGGEGATARASAIVQMARNLGGVLGTALLGILAAHLLG